MMIRFLTASALAALSCSVAHAELRDVSLLQSDGQTRLWLTFDDQPQAVEVQPGSGLVLHVDGVNIARSRHIEPAVRGPISALVLSRAPDGVSISMSGAFSGGEAEVREGGVLITLTGVTGQSVPIRRTPPRTNVSEQGGEESTTAAAADSASSGDEPAAPPTSSAASAPEPDHNADGATESGSAPQALAADPERPGSAAGSQAQMRQLGGDLVIDESVCPDTAARLVDAPWDLNLLSTHADCLVSLGDSESAVSLYQRVLAFDPRHFQAALGLARIMSDQGDHQAAAELFETAAGAARTDGQAVQARMAARRARELAGSGGN